MEKKRSSVLVILIAIVSILAILAMIPYQEEEVPFEPEEEREVWEITGEEVIKDETLILSSDLLVKDGGKLSLDYSRLIFNNDENNFYEITIEEDGALILHDSSINIINNEKIHEDSSFFIKVYGELDVGNCNIRYFEIQVFSDDVVIKNSEISNSLDSGIYIKDSSPLIEGNWIHENIDGIEGDNATPEVTDNNLSLNSYAMAFYNKSVPLINQNRLSDNHVGIMLRECENVSVNNNYILGNYWGINVYQSKNLSLENNLFNNIWDDLSIHDSMLRVRNCIFQKSEGEDIDCWNSILVIVNCTSFSEDFIYIYNSTAEISNNMVSGSLSMRKDSNVTITNNAFSGSSPYGGSGISVHSSQAIVQNNAISGFYRGIEIEGGSDDEYPVSIKYNRIENASVGIRSYHGNMLEIQENEIINASLYDLNIEISDAKIINSAHSDDKMEIYFSTITFVSILDLNVIDENSLPLDANVTIYDHEGNIAFNGTCDANGQIMSMPLEYRNISRFDDRYQKSYSIRVSHEGSEITTFTLMDRPKELTIVLGDLGDLQIDKEDLFLSEDIAEDGEIVDIKAKVHNIGSENIENITVNFYIEGDLIGNSLIYDIPPGENETASIEWTAFVGEWEITAQVTTDHQETNPLGNNEAKSDIRVVDMAIDTAESYSYETWEMDGDVVIEEGGVLELDNITIIMNSTHDRLLWNVMDGGELIMTNCIISARDEFYPYEFRIYGKAKLEGTHISGIGPVESSYFWWFYDRSDGIQIYSDDVVVSNCTIKNIDVGIYCYKSAPLVHNNTIINSDHTGIYCLGSNATISQNRINSNQRFGIYVDGSYYSLNSEPLIDNNTISNSNNGIYVAYSRAMISNNSIFNNTDGIECDDSEVTIIKNKIFNNVNGISDYSGRYSTIHENHIEGNSNGISLQQSICNITRNEIIKNEYGIIIGEANYEDDSVSFIENNIVSCNSRSGFLIYGFFPVIKNNTLGNNSEWAIDIFNGNAEIVNNSYEYDGMSNGNGRIIRRITLTVRVRDPIDRYLDYANLKIVCSNGTVFHQEKMKSGAWYSNYLYHKAPVVYIQDNMGIENSYEYLVEVEREGVTNSTTVSVNSSNEVTIYLHLLPDLEVKEIEVGKYFMWANDGRKPREGDNITIRIYVSNHGNGTAFNVPVRTFIDGKLVNENIISWISAKSTEYTNFKWIVKPGNHTFEANLDSENIIPELSEDNNHATTYKKFDTLPQDFTFINTILVVCLIFMIMTFIFWIRWRYEVWRRD